MLHRDGRIQTGFGLFVPCGLRAGALVADCFAIGRTYYASHPVPGRHIQKSPAESEAVLYMVPRDGIEPSTRGLI